MAQLGGEPWGFPPHVLARLTDEQIDRIYFAPRNEKGELIPPSSATVEADDESAFFNRELFVASMLAEFGMTAEHWNSEFDKLEASRG